MRKIVGIAVVSLCILSCAGSATAWEFRLTGETVWRYRYITRTGPNDIFGHMNGDDLVNLGVNHLRDFPTPDTSNAFAGNLGVLAGEHNFGPDMGLNDVRVTLYPTIKINKAIKLTGSINLTSLGLHSGGRPYGNRIVDFDTATIGGTTNVVRNADHAGYFNSLWVPISDRLVGSNVPNMMVTVQWWKMSVKTPMMDFSIGTKTGGWGYGLWRNKEERGSTSFSLSSKYGPFKFGVSPYFGRGSSNWDRWSRNDRHVHSPWRRQGDRNYFGGLTMNVMYKSGPLTISFDRDGWYTPSWPDESYVPRNRDGSPNPISTGRPGENTWVFDSTVAIKYFDGRFFFNAEASHFWMYNSGRGTTEASGTRIRVGRNQDAWIYGTETGILFGPNKLTLSYIRATGDDPSTRITNEDAANGDAGVSPYAMLHWGYLMYYVYGTGTSWNQAGEGQPSNLHHLGVRLDYAVAANLNTFVVYSYAWRDQVNAFRLGGNGQYTAEAFDNDNIRTRTGQAVPESANDIGWEVDWGFNWKLLENLDWNLIFALWMPGSFWSHAYPDTSQIYQAHFPNVPVDYANATIGLGRAIDPLFAMQSELAVQF